MLKEQLYNKIRKYKGSDSFVHKLQENLNNGEEISDLQLSLVRRILDNKTKTKKKEQKKDAQKIKKNIEKNNDTLKRIRVTDEDFENVSPNIILYPYQKEGVKWLLENYKGRFLLDEQGTGKTLQTIYACEIGKFNRVFILCPNYLKYNWKHEISKVNPSVQILKKESDLYNDIKYTILNYDSVHKYAQWIAQGKQVDCIICDESHFLKIETSRRSIYTKPLSHKAKRMWLLTGTPKDNRLIDLYNQLSLLGHPLGENKYYFGSRYCNTNPDNPMDFSGAKNLDELYRVLFSSVAIRRTKKLLNLPKKTYETVYFELKDVSGYREMVKKYIEKISSPEYIIGGSSDLAEINLLKQFHSLEKIDHVVELIDDILSENPNSKIVIFSNFTNVIDAYMERFKGLAIRHDGKVGSPEQKAKNLAQFDNGSEPILVAQYRDSHAGLNLQVANFIIFNETAQTPGISSQASDRIHRIGQDQDCIIYVPLFEGTIDETVYQLFQQEELINKNLLEGEDNELNYNFFKKLHLEVLRQSLSIVATS